MKKLKQATAQKPNQHLSANIRRASQVPDFLEVNEKQWKKLIPKSDRDDNEKFIAQDFTEIEETKVYLGTINGRSTVAFCKKTAKMEQRIASFGLRAQFENNCFWVAVEKIPKNRLHEIAIRGGSNAVEGDTHYLQINYDEHFNLWSPDGTLLYVAENWAEFDNLLHLIPIYFNSKVSNGKLQLFDWHSYSTKTINKLKKKI